ncbi:MAG TPA: DUF6687 family protein, partial [Trichormus sp.]
TLSHWPGNQTPGDLKADLSAEIVLNYLENPQHHIDVAAASNTHFDADGLMGLWALLNPEGALARKQLLVDVASAGDFGVCHDRDAARVCFVLSSWGDPDRSPLNQQVFQLPYMELTAVLYEELLKRLENILDRVEYLEQFWIDEDRLLDATEAEIAAGNITIEEHPEIDLAVVTLPEPPSSQRQELLAKPWNKLFQTLGVHNETGRMRILLRQANRYELYFRYETWVEYVSRQLMPRVDMAALANELNTQEEPGCAWEVDDIDSLQPSLKLKGAAESKISAAEFQDRLASYLVSHGDGGK